jgi:glycosyltransferase involved in cell wall biosynthesis
MNNSSGFYIQNNSIQENNLFIRKSNSHKNYTKKYLLSVITVTFNAGKYLEETILSIVNQTFRDIEFIIIDGGSTDETIDIIKKYESKISYWTSEDDEGVFDAMNKGIDIASGKWINFMNAGDCFFEHDTLAKVASLLEKSNVEIVYGNTVIKYDESYKKTKILSPDLKFDFGLPFCHQSVFVRSDLYKSAKFNTEYQIYSDYDFFLNCFKKKCAFSFVSEIIAIYNCGGLSSQRSLKHYKELYSISCQEDNVLHSTKVLTFILNDIIKELLKTFLPLSIVRKIQFLK